MSLVITISVLMLLFRFRVLGLCKIDYCWNYDSKFGTLKIERVNLGFLTQRHIFRHSSANLVLADDANIFDIMPRTFRKSKHVHTISLTHNKLRVLGNYTFDGCVKLKFINLSGNRIGKISPKAFRTKNPIKQFHLVSLILSKNRIRKLQSTIFDDCCFKSLKRFDISGNWRLRVRPRELLKNFEVLDWPWFRDTFFGLRDYNKSIFFNSHVSQNNQI